MSIRNAVLIVDKNGDIGDQISERLRPRGYHTVCVGEAESFLPLLESMDRIYTILCVDQNFRSEALKQHIKVLKILGPGVPIIFTTAMNEPQKEKEVRKAGVFFYHVKTDGMKRLTNAIVRAVEYAIMKDMFIAGFEDQ